MEEPNNGTAFLQAGLKTCVSLNGVLHNEVECVRETRNMLPTCFPHSRDHIGSIVCNNCMDLIGDAPFICDFCQEFSYIVCCVLHSYIYGCKIARLHLPVLIDKIVAVCICCTFILKVSACCCVVCAGNFTSCFRRRPSPHCNEE